MRTTFFEYEEQAKHQEKTLSRVKQTKKKLTCIGKSSRLRKVGELSPALGLSLFFFFRKFQGANPNLGYLLGKKNTNLKKIV